MSLFLFTACGGEDSSATFKLVNNSTYSVDQLYVSPTTATTWGDDQLSSTLAPGNTFTLTGVACDKAYDILVVAVASATAWVKQPSFSGNTWACDGTYTLTIN